MLPFGVAWLNGERSDVWGQRLNPFEWRGNQKISIVAILYKDAKNNYAYFRIKPKIMKPYWLLGSLVLLSHCVSSPPKKQPQKQNSPQKKIQAVVEEEPQDTFPYLDDKNAIPFLFAYEKELTTNRVQLDTRFGAIVIELFEDTPYHRANFIYLTERGYFNGTTFHRVVPGFIIQGGNSDRPKTARNRRKIGRYLLPNDLRNDHKHHRGVVSMPSSEIDNPYKLASPYEFFIVQQKGGAYHLDGNYTPFGRVVEGMAVVDSINSQAVDKREAPLQNIYLKAKVLR